MEATSLKMNYLNFLYSLTAAFFVIVIFKTFYFFRSTSERSVGRWIYFNKVSLYGSRSLKKLRLKKMQNLLSIIILVLFVSDMLLVLAHMERMI